MKQSPLSTPTNIRDIPVGTVFCATLTLTNLENNGRISGVVACSGIYLRIGHNERPGAVEWKPEAVMLEAAAHYDGDIGGRFVCDDFTISGYSEIPGYFEDDEIVDTVHFDCIERWGMVNGLRVQLDSEEPQGIEFPKKEYDLLMMEQRAEDVNEDAVRENLELFADCSKDEAERVINAIMKSRGYHDPEF